MPSEDSVPYKNYLQETIYAINKCYPIEKGSTLIGATTIMYEIKDNPNEYPEYSKIKEDRHRKMVLTHNCITDLNYILWGKSRGSYKNGAVYQRDL